MRFSDTKPMNDLIPLADVPAMLPPRPNGRHISRSTIARWVHKGVGGRRLRACKVGGLRYIRVKDFEAFAFCEDENSTRTTLRTSRSRSMCKPDLWRRHGEDELVLAAAGW